MSTVANMVNSKLNTEKEIKREKVEKKENF